MGERLRRLGIATCAVLLGASALAACTVSVPAGVLGAVLSLAAFGALIAGFSVGAAGCDDGTSGPRAGLRGLPPDSDPADHMRSPGFHVCLMPHVDEPWGGPDHPAVGDCLEIVPDGYEWGADAATEACLEFDPGPCLEDIPDADDSAPADSAADADVGPCLKVIPDAEDPDIGPCLRPAPPDVGGCLGVDPDWGETDDPGMEPCLRMIPDTEDTDDSDVEGEDSAPTDEGAGRAPGPSQPGQPQAPSASWSSSFARMMERGALPPDVAERLRRRPPRRG